MPQRETGSTSGEASTILSEMSGVEEGTWTEKGSSVRLNDPVIVVEPDREFAYWTYVNVNGG